MGESHQRKQNSHHRVVPWTDVVVVASMQKEMDSSPIALTAVGWTGSPPIALTIVGWS
jgi:hypothetical protein